MIRKIFHVLQSVGIDCKRMASLRNIFRYLFDAGKYLARGGRITSVMPFLNDYSASAGTARGHYFNIDLIAAQQIYKMKPNRHIDIGSRIDGFVAHVASFRSVEVADIRPIQIDATLNISSIQMDLMRPVDDLKKCTDSLSCLHALEHFGLGRYGDPISPDGHIVGFRNLLEMVSDGGMLYIAFPISKENSVVFNAHRIFDKNEIFKWIPHGYKVDLLRFDYVDSAGVLHPNVELPSVEALGYACGLYSMRINRLI